MLRLKCFSVMLMFDGNHPLQVPDPRNGEISIGDSWPKLRTENLMQDNSSLTSYGDIQSFPFLRMSGISSVQLVCVLF